METLSLCPTWWPLKVKLTDDDGSGLDITGSQEFERVIWSLKLSLKSLYLGNYMWDDMLVYICEMCKNLEQIRLNSQ